MNEIIAFIVEYLGKSSSRYVVVPIITIVVNIAIKYICQNDKYNYSLREYGYLAPQLSTTALLVVFLDFCTNVHHVENAEIYSMKVIVAFLIWLIVMWVMMIIIRKLGWFRDFDGKIKPTLWCGIIIPDVVGLLLLFVMLNIMTT